MDVTTCSWEARLGRAFAAAGFGLGWRRRGGIAALGRRRVFRGGPTRRGGGGGGGGGAGVVAGGAPGERAGAGVLAGAPQRQAVAPAWVRRWLPASRQPPHSPGACRCPAAPIRRRTSFHDREVL